MKIIVIASLAYSVINFRGRLIAAMIGNGHEVMACAPGRDPEIEAKLARAGMNPFADMGTLSWLIGCFRKNRPDAAMAYMQKPIIYGGTGES